MLVVSIMLEKNVNAYSLPPFIITL